MSILPDHHRPERTPVTLPRVMRITEGRGYVTVEVQHEQDASGEHMRAKVKRRAVRRGV